MPDMIRETAKCSEENGLLLWETGTVFGERAIRSPDAAAAPRRAGQRS